MEITLNRPFIKAWWLSMNEFYNEVMKEIRDENIEYNSQHIKKQIESDRDEGFEWEERVMFIEIMPTYLSSIR